MENISQNPIALFGAAPDTGNQGVTALCYSVLDGLARFQLGPVTVYDHGRGRRTGRIRFGARQISFDKLGAIYGRRYYRPENFWHMKTVALGGGLWSASARTVCRAQAVLDVSGGDSFTEIYGKDRFKTVTLPKQIALSAGRRLILLPQTYGPFHSESAIAAAQDIMRRADMAWARDETSFDTLKNLVGADFDPDRHRLGVDMAFGLPATAPRMPLPACIAEWLAKDSTHRPVIGLNVSGLLYNNPEWAKGQFNLHENYRHAILDAIEGLLSRTEARILLVPHVVVGRADSECDLLACQSLLEEFGPAADRLAMLDGSHDAAELKWIIAKTDWFCGTRMHSTIAGLSSCVPTMALAYSMKTRGVFETCDQGHQVFDLRNRGGRELAESMIQSWRARSRAGQRLRATMPHIRTRAVEQMRTIARAVLTPGRTRQRHG